MKLLFVVILILLVSEHKKSLSWCPGFSYTYLSEKVLLNFQRPARGLWCSYSCELLFRSLLR